MGTALGFYSSASAWVGNLHRCGIPKGVNAKALVDCIQGRSNGLQSKFLKQRSGFCELYLWFRSSSLQIRISVRGAPRLHCCTNLPSTSGDNLHYKRDSKGWIRLTVYPNRR